MRFGQLSVQDMVPDITPLMKARQMKDQAFQNLAGTVMQLSAQKEKKTLEKKQIKQAISAVTPFIDAMKARDSSLSDFNAKDFVSAVGPKEAISKSIDFMRTIAIEDQQKKEVQAQVALAKAAQVENKININTSNLATILNYEFGTQAGSASTQEMTDRSAQLIAENPERFGNAKVGEAVQSAFDRGVKTSTELGNRNKEIGSVLARDVDTTGKQIQRRSMIFESATRVQGLLADLSEDAQKELSDLVSSEFLASGKSLENIEGTEFQTVLKNVQLKLGSLIPGSDASTFLQAIQSLSGQIANATLQGTRSDSIDGSSGYGQLTGPELTLLKNFYGALVTESGSAASIENISFTLNRIIEDMPRGAITARDLMYENIGIRTDLGISDEVINKRFKISLGGKDPSEYSLFKEVFESDNADNNLLPIPSALLNPVPGRFLPSSIQQPGATTINGIKSYIDESGDTVVELPTRKQ